MIGIKEFDGSIGAAQEWLDDLKRRLGWHDREKVYLALVATLHALRDSLPIHEAVFLGDCLPITLRGSGGYPGTAPIDLARNSWSAFSMACITIPG